MIAMQSNAATYRRHLRQVIVVLTPSFERMLNSSIRRLTPGRPMPIPREVE